MAYSDSQKKASMKYIAANLEEVRFRVRKGERALLQEEAGKNGLSMAQYLIQAVNEKAGRQLLTPSSTEEK